MGLESVPLADTAIVDHGAISEEQQKQLEDAGAKLILSPPPHDAPQSPPASEVLHIGPYVERVRRDHPELVRSFNLAMAKSTVHATARVAAVAELYHAEAYPIARM